MNSKPQKSSPSASLAPGVAGKLKQFFQVGLEQGCPKEQLMNFSNAGIILQARQLAASAAARLCDQPDGPKAVGYGGARGGGKTHWLVAQMGADDGQRMPGLKCLLLRKVGKANLENFEALRQRLFHRLPHDFNVARGILTFENGSRIILGHYQCEKDIDTYLGLEYDVIGIEEATQLTARKYEDISSCCRTSKPDWRPRIYSTTNPGDIGHQWYLDKFIVPHQSGTETDTRFIPARVTDNAFINAEYKQTLCNYTGWRRNAWYLGQWNFPAGQYFRNFRPEIHVLGGEGPGQSSDAAQAVLDNGLHPPPAAPEQSEFWEKIARLRRFRESNAVEWFASMDYGYTHLTVVLLGCFDHEENIYVLDEHAERFWVAQRHAQAVKDMLARHRVYAGIDHLRQAVRAQYPDYCREQELLWYGGQKRMLARFVAGTDMFASESNGDSVARQYRELGLSMRAANMDRVSGWSAILQRLGDPEAGILPSLFIHKRCKRLLESLPYVQHDSDRPGDVIKTNINEEGEGGDDALDALRYMVATRPARVYVRKLTGL